MEGEVVFSVNNDTKPLRSIVGAIRDGGVLKHSFRVFVGR